VVQSQQYNLRGTPNMKMILENVCGWYVSQNVKKIWGLGWDEKFVGLRGWG